MKRTGFKPRKVSLRDAWVKKMKEKGTKKIWTPSGKLIVKKPLKKLSKARRNKMKEYYAIHDEFLALPENRDCLICKRRREDGEDILQHRATEVHHRDGRCGKKLCDTADFIPSCFHCRMWPHENPKKARELNLLK